MKKAIFFTLFIIVTFMIMMIVYAAQGGTAADDNDTELARYAQELHKFVIRAEDWTKISSSSILRTIVCRVASSDISVNALQRATGISKEEIMNGVKDLMQSRLVWIRFDDFNGDVILSPDETNPEAKRRLKEYAKWCSNDEACGVER